MSNYAIKYVPEVTSDWGYTYIVMQSVTSIDAGLNVMELSHEISN